MRLLLTVQATSTTTSPWWGVPVVAGAFALGGALITVLLNYIQGRRQHNARWEKELRETSREFLSLVRADLRAVLDAARGTERQTREAREARNAVVAGYSELFFVAPQGVVDTAWRVLETLRAFDASRRSTVNGNSSVDEWRNHLQAVSAFRNSVRVSLGLPRLTQPSASEDFDIP